MFFVDRIWDALTSRFVNKEVSTPAVEELKPLPESEPSKRTMGWSGTTPLFTHPNLTSGKSFCSGCFVNKEVSTPVVEELKPLPESEPSKRTMGWSSTTPLFTQPILASGLLIFSSTDNTNSNIYKRL